MKSFFGEVLPDRGESELFPAAVRSDEQGRYRLEGVYPTRGGPGTTIWLCEYRARGQIKAERVAVAPGETVQFTIG